MSSEKNGLTLIEVLVAILIFSIGVIGVITLFPLSIQNVQTSQDVLIATELAASTLEFFNQPGIQDAVAGGLILSGFMPIKDIDSGGSIVIPNTQEYHDLDDSTLSERYTGYERAVDVSLIPSDADFNDRYSVTVTIRWNDVRGRGRTFRMSGIIYAYKKAL